MNIFNFILYMKYLLLSIVVVGTGIIIYGIIMTIRNRGKDKFQKRKDVFRCPHCNKKMSEVDAFCPHCGGKIHKKKVVKTKEESKEYLDRVSKKLLEQNLQIKSSGISNKSIVGGIIFLLLITAGILWYTGVIPICGDTYCVSKECKSGCRDCSPDACQDGLCQPQVKETCLNSQDCTCDTNQECQPTNSRADKKGCYEIVCGDGKCDSKKEDQSNCCKDCGCSGGYTCDNEKNECLFLMPEISIESYSITSSVSASTLYSNRELKDDSGTSHPFATFRIKNTGKNTAKNTNLMISIGSYTQQDSQNLGDLTSNQVTTYNWYPTVTDSMLDIKDDRNLIISLKIDYQDDHGKKYTISKSFPVVILGRNSIGAYTASSQFVTPLDSVVRSAASAAGSFSTSSDEGIHDGAEAIWNLLGNLNIDYISDPAKEYRQYPAEVLSTKRGDCDDLATLYAALLESVGIETVLISIPGHMFMGYYAGGYIWPVEATLIGASFSQASQSGKDKYNSNSDKTVLKVRQEWSKKNIKTPSSVGVSSVDLKFPNIQASIGGQSAEWKVIDEGFLGIGARYGLYIYCDVAFHNSGTAQGKKCVSVVTYVDNNVVKTENVCETVRAGDYETERTTYSQEYGSSFAFNYRCEVR